LDIFVDNPILGRLRQPAFATLHTCEPDTCPDRYKSANDNVHANDGVHADTNDDRYT
jgi:hypothetical protein